MSVPDMVGTGPDSAQCHDGAKDGDETDMDCGGSCEPCATGQMCNTGSDCTSTLCNSFTNRCVGTRCEDGVRDGNETDVDCGGGACLPCGDGKGCKANADCTSDICDLATDTCSNTLCMDGIRDGAETDVDCGGPACPKCLGGKSCDGNSDCLSNVCGAQHTCAASQCEDGVKDGSETDVDCGGAVCPACALTKACAMNSDCVSHYCNVVSLICVADQCHDGS
jgi:hypothetical protein